MSIFRVLTVQKISPILILEHLFVIALRKGDWKMLSENETALIGLIRENDNPEKIAGYMLSLFLDYLRKHGPSQEKPSADPRVSA